MINPLMHGQKRLRLVMLVFLGCFVALNVRLVSLAVTVPEVLEPARGEVQARIPRPPIVDRNGQMLATDIRIPSLAADPRKIIDVDEAVELLTATLPDLDARDLRNKLTLKPGQRRAFVWIKRELTQKQRDMVHDLGIPGLEFRTEIKRIYPMGRMAAHVLGYVDVDRRGLAGIEKYLDEKGALFKASLADPSFQKAAPAELSIDVRVQHAVMDELAQAMATYQALAATGIVMDVHTGEIVAAVSLPDYNPNKPIEAQFPQHLNRFTGGAFELGSVVKTLTFAMALDAGTATMDSTYDVRNPIAAGSARIDDYRPERRILTLPEVFLKSSNIGTAMMALDVGQEAHEAFLRKVGLYGRPRTELPEAAAPLVPSSFGRIAAMTASFGHGISFTPLQLVQATCAIVNGGTWVEATFLKQPGEPAPGARIISTETSEKMRYLLRLNAQEGTGSKADVPGYRVGGKTGTAEKVIAGRYSGDHRLNSYLAAFPMEAPRYVMLVMLDEPKPTPDSHGFATAGYNAVPTAGKIIARIAPMLGIAPELSDADRERIAAEEESLEAARLKEAALVGEAR